MQKRCVDQLQGLVDMPEMQRHRSSPQLGGTTKPALKISVVCENSLSVYTSMRIAHLAADKPSQLELELVLST